MISAESLKGVKSELWVYRALSSEEAYYAARKDDIHHETNNNNEDFCHYSILPQSAAFYSQWFSLSSHLISPVKRSSVMFLLGACSDMLSYLSTLTA